MSHSSNNLKSIFLALGANFVIAIAKFLAAFKTGSGSMMAEAIHSSSDCINQVLLLIGIKRSKRPPNDNFPLGHGKELYFYSFIVSILIFSIGGLFSIYEGIHKFHSTDPISNPLIAVSVLVFAILAEGFAFFGCLKEVKRLKANRSYGQWTRETRKTELLVVLGEDFAALFGLIFALTAILLSHFTGNPRYDAIGSIVIGGLLILVAFLLSKIIKDLLIGRGVDPHSKNLYSEHMESFDGIDKVLNLVTMCMGDDVLVSFKVQMDSKLSSKEMIHLINQAESSLKEKYSEIHWLFVEPDFIK